jgi:cytochrome c oxidase subunit 2
VTDADLKPGQPRLLTTDNTVVVPVDTNVRLLTTATDVIHSWAVPSFGVKIDAIPGRINESWFRILRPGIYYGQCSELCGDLHGFMPIMVKAVPKDEFKTWVEQAKKQFAQSGTIDLARR